MGKLLILKNQDERLVYVSKFLKLKGYDIVSITDQNTLMTELEKGNVEAVLLPVRGVNDDGIVDGTELSLSTSELRLLKGKTIFSGLLNSRFNKICLETDVKFKTYLDEDVAIKNNYITVEGVIGHITNSSKQAILNSNILVIGYGKLGQITATLFKRMKANVTIVARDQKDLTHAKIAGIKTLSYSDLVYEIREFDFIINTVPAHVIDEILLSQLSESNTKIIDLASKPYGLNHELAKIKKVETVILGALPGKIAPKTSGELIASNVLKYIAGGALDAIK